MAAASNPGDAAGPAVIDSASLEVWEERGEEEDVGEIIDLHATFMTAWASVELERGKPSVENQIVNDRHVYNHCIREFHDSVWVFHIDLHNLDLALGVVFLHVGIGEELGFAGFGFGGVSHGEDDGGHFEG